MIPMRFLAPLRAWSIPFLLLGVLWFSMLSGEAQNKKMTDPRMIRSVIEQQLQAFQKDDANKAFSFASPSIQKRFGNAQNFMIMVKESYPAVYRPRSVIFEKLNLVGDNPTQFVLLLDPSGTLMKAIYIMERQGNGSWLINGCYLVTADGQTL